MGEGWEVESEQRNYLQELQQAGESGRENKSGRKNGDLVREAADSTHQPGPAHRGQGIKEAQLLSGHGALGMNGCSKPYDIYLNLRI